MTMTVSTMQLGVCALYALILWVIGLNPVKLCGFQAPDKQALPKSTKDDISIRHLFTLTTLRHGGHALATMHLGTGACNDDPIAIT